MKVIFCYKKRKKLHAFLLISWYFWILERCHGLAKEGTEAKALAVPFLCDKMTQFSWCTRRTNLSWSSWPVSLHHPSQPTNIKQKNGALSQSAAKHAALPSSSTLWWEEDGLRTSGCSRALQRTSLVPHLHRLTGSAGREGESWPCTQLCWSPQWVLTQPHFCLAHGDTSSHDEVDIFTTNTPYAQDLQLALAYVQWCHRIIEWFGLEGTFKGYLVQHPCSEQGQLQLNQVAAPGEVDQNLFLSQQTK